MKYFGPLGFVSLFQFERLNSISRKSIKGNNSNYYVQEIAKNSSIQEDIIFKELIEKDIEELNHVLSPLQVENNSNNFPFY
jgi:hypothetical protein